MSVGIGQQLALTSLSSGMLVASLAQVYSHTSEMKYHFSRFRMCCMLGSPPLPTLEASLRLGQCFEHFQENGHMNIQYNVYLNGKFETGQPHMIV